LCLKLRLADKGDAVQRECACKMLVQWSVW
jgi:hypothetical protein